MLPGLQTEVRLTRPEFEAMIRPVLRETIETLERALASAGVSAADLGAVLLVGGSSRIPLVAEMVGAALGRPVSVDAHPKHTVALGAARLAASGERGKTANPQQRRRSLRLLRHRPRRVRRRGGAGANAGADRCAVDRRGDSGTGATVEPHPPAGRHR